MDLLKKELERKKKALQSAKSSDDVALKSGGRFLNASKLRRFQEEQDENRRQQGRWARQGDNANLTKTQTQPTQPSVESKKRNRATSEQPSQTETNTATKANDANKSQKTTLGQDVKTVPSSESSIENLHHLTAQQVTQRFRELGLPIRLFGEITLPKDDSATDSSQSHHDDKRLERLKRALAERKETLASLSEKAEFRLGKGHGIRNPFLEKDNDRDAKTVMLSNENNKDSKASKKKEEDEEEEEDEDDASDDHKRIYKYFKGLLKQWEADLDERPETVRRSVAGRNEAKTVKQCRDYIQPLFKLCKKRRLDESIVRSLSKIVSFCKEGEFVKAHDTYMDIAIGRAAWPIGVTMVGIHARTGRAKIESQNVAHVMNSELQRKYLTSVKRLMTYAQNKRDDVDPSKKVR